MSALPMIKNTAFLFVFLSSFLFSIKLIGQNPSLSQIKITKFYSDPLDAVLLDIGTKYKVRFSYDWFTIHQFTFKGNFNNTPLDSILNMMCDQFNLKYGIDDGFVDIVQKKEKSTTETEEIKEEIYVEDRKIYTGAPSAYNFNLSGTIKDALTGESLPYAIIQIKETKTSAITNADGFFTLLKVPSDTAILEVIYMGYHKKNVFLTPSMPKTNLSIELIPKNMQLKAVEVKAVKDEIMNITSGVGDVTMAPQKLASLPNIGEKDIMRSFQLMPGISCSNESSSGLYVRGGTPDQNLIVYDGFTVYHVDHLYGFFSAFNSNAIKDIQLYKGGFESRFGGRLSSVTEITGKEGNKKNFSMGGDISLLSANLYAETPLGKKITLLVAGRKSYKGPLYNKIFKKFNKTTVQNSVPNRGNMSGVTTTVTSYFYDVNSKLTYKPTDKDIVQLSFYNGADKLDNSRETDASKMGGGGGNFNFDVNDLTNFGNLGGALKWSRKWTNKIYGNTIASYSNYYSKRDRSNERTTTDSNGDEKTTKVGEMENNNLKDFSFKSDYQWDIFKGSQIGMGYFATYNDIKYSYAQNDTSTILNKHDYGTSTGIYLQDKIKLFNEKLVLLPGVRYTYFSKTDHTYTEPRFSISYNFTDKIKFKASTGKYYQMINRVIREDISAGSRDFWMLSDNDKIPVSSAIHYIAGTSYETKKYLFDVEAYYKKLDGLTEYSLRIRAKPGSIDYSESFYNGSGTAKGIEFLAQKKSGNLNGWVSYTLAEAMDNFPAYSDKDFPASQDVTHEFKIVTMYQWKKWEFACTWMYATGRPYTAPEGGYQVTLLDGTTKDFITVGAKNGLRLPDYNRLDISTNFHFKNRDGLDVGYIGFSIFNLYNRKNVWYKEYEIVESTIVETNVNYLGFTPNITLSLKIK